MKKNNNFNFVWLVITLGLIAMTGFCFTPAFAEDIDPETGKLLFQQEEEIVPGDDSEITDENFGRNYQATWVPSYSFTPYSSSTQYANDGANYRYLTSGTNPWMDA